MRQIISLVIMELIFAAVSATAQTRCRLPSQPYNLSNADLPICKTTAKQASSRPPQRRYLPVRRYAPPRQYASVPNSPLVTFDSYMRENANNPVLSPRVPHYEEAFVEPPPQITQPAKPTRVPASTNKPIPNKVKVDATSNTDFSSY